MSRLGPFEENTIVVGDCLEIMAQMPDGCVDLVVTDPPYNIGKDYEGDFNDAKPEEQYWAWYQQIIQSLLRVMQDGRLYISCTDPQIPTVRQLIQGGGFIYEQMLIWHGPNVFHSRRRIDYPWVCDYEPVLLFRKGKRMPMQRANHPEVKTTAVLRHARPQSNFKEGRIHPTQKPIKLYRDLIMRTPGALIFDPFIGSGTTAVVADRLGRKFFGCDINPDYVEMALARLEKDRAGRQLALL